MILYEDKHIIVCHKPAGIPVQSARIGQKDMVSILNNYLAESAEEKYKKPEENRGTSDAVRAQRMQAVYVVHRLDQPVEGVIVFAKTKKAASELGGQITDGTMRKVYHAVCLVTDKAKQELQGGQEQSADRKKTAPVSQNGDLQGKNVYQLVDYLVKNGRTNTSSIAAKGDRDAKKAELSFRVLQEKAISGRPYLLAEIDLKTGRHHQIRVQMANAGLPLYGDQKYGAADTEKNLSDAQAPSTRSEDEKEAGRHPKNGKKVPLALCAVSLSFRHPATKKTVNFNTHPQGEIFKSFTCCGSADQKSDIFTE